MRDTNVREGAGGREELSSRFVVHVFPLQFDAVSLQSTLFLGHGFASQNLGVTCTALRRSVETCAVRPIRVCICGSACFFIRGSLSVGVFCVPLSYFLCLLDCFLFLSFVSLCLSLHFSLCMCCFSFVSFWRVLCLCVHLVCVCVCVCVCAECMCWGRLASGRRLDRVGRGDKTNTIDIFFFPLLLRATVYFFFILLFEGGRMFVHDGSERGRPLQAERTCRM